MAKPFVKYFIWSIAATLWATICFIVPDFADNPSSGIHGIITIITYICACGLGNFFILYLVGCNKYFCAIFLPLYGIAGAALSFYRYIYRVTITPMIIDVTLHTNAEEALGVISWQLVAWIIFNLGISIIFCRWRWKLINLSYSWLHLLIALLIGCTYFMSNERLRTSLLQRYPCNLFYNIIEYRSLRHKVAETRIIPTYIPSNNQDSITIVLILGEAARADHLQLNGYKRETTPRLCARKNIISFANIYSEQTHTSASLPYILTRADSIHEEYQYSETSFIPIFKNEGYQTSWISNQDMGDSFAHFLAECDTSIFANAGKSVYVFAKWLDEELLPHFRKSESSSASRKLHVLHTIGSHWYFDNHIPDDKYYFQPHTSNRLVTNNTIEQLTNSYDNTIRYMDFFVDSVISIVEDKNALVIYQSDHGEALGEEGEYLHANDAEPVHHPACIIWYSDRYAKANPEKVAALIENKDKRYRTDYVFYSILYAAGIEAEGDNKQVNIFR